MKEHALQNAIRNALVDEGMFFRANVGTGWQGERDRQAEFKLGGRNVIVLRSARPFNTGLPPGFLDVFGVVPTVITPEMVGQTVGIATFVEAKSPTGRASERQIAFIDTANQLGARAGIARSVEHAIDIVQGRRRASK